MKQIYDPETGQLVGWNEEPVQEAVRKVRAVFKELLEKGYQPMEVQCLLSETIVDFRSEWTIQEGLRRHREKEGKKPFNG